MREAWDTQRGWIEENNPRVAFEVAIRYLNGMSVTDEQMAASNIVREGIRDRVRGLLSNGAMHLLPDLADSSASARHARPRQGGVG